MTSKKVVGIVLLVLVVCVILFISATYLIFDFLPQMKVNKELKKYYGTWELVEDEFGKLSEDKLYYYHKVFSNYKTNKTITINKNNLECQTDKYSVGFNDTEKGFAITTYQEDMTEGEYYLFIELEQLIQSDEETFDNEGKKIPVCFELRGDMLIQKDCPSKQFPNLNLKYKIKNKK